MAQFTNQAQLSYNNSVKNSNIAVGEIQEVLSAVKTAISTCYSAGEDVTYALSVINSGSSPLTNITVTDDLGTYTWQSLNLTPLTYVADTLKYYINGTLQAPPAVNATSSALTISGLTIPAESSAMLLYEAKTNQFAPLPAQSLITNQATVSGNAITSVTADATLTVECEPNLSITKSISPVPVSENGTLTYTFVIQNTGNRDAAASDNVVITDIFNPILKNLVVTFNKTLWTADQEFTYDDTSGTFVSTKGALTVPAATFVQDTTTGAWAVDPGVSTLTISGTV